MKLQFMLSIEMNDADLLQLVEMGKAKPEQINDVVMGQTIAHAVAQLAGRIPSVTRTGCIALPDLLKPQSSIIVP
jgi:hypothetical protein